MWPLILLLDNFNKSIEKFLYLSIVNMCNSFIKKGTRHSIGTVNMQLFAFLRMQIYVSTNV